MRTVDIPRHLWYWPIGGERTVISQEELLAISRPFVVLGEPGMGKTQLAAWLGKQGFARYSARSFLNLPDVDPDGPLTIPVVIDALDEVPARTDGDVVDHLLRKLRSRGVREFVLTCRVLDWQGATSRQAIKDIYSTTDVQELHIEPLSEEEARLFLAGEVGDSRASEVLKHFESRGMVGSLGNPQTLQLLSRLAGQATLPESTGQLFDMATTQMWAEASESKANSILAGLDRDVVLDALGAAFAALILGGRDAISRQPVPLVDDNDIHVGKLNSLPRWLHADSVLESRLVRALDSKRFSYLHRRIGEFLGARWLGKLVDSDRKRRRLLSSLSYSGKVPASVRGIHGWLAYHNEKLAREVICTDPIGVIEYGEADSLSPTQARLLLEALLRVGNDNPHFKGWRSHRAVGLIQQETISRVRELLGHKSAPYGVRALLLEQLALSQFGPAFSDVIKVIAADVTEVYAVRSVAMDAADAHFSSEEWSQLFLALRQLKDDATTRLLLESLTERRIGQISDAALSRLVVDFSGQESPVGGVLYLLQKRIPPARVDGLLNMLLVEVSRDRSGVLHKEGDDDEDESPRSSSHHELSDFMLAMIARRLEMGDVEPLRLWAWLDGLAIESSYRPDAQQLVAAYIEKNDELRRKIQKYVLLDVKSDFEVWGRAWRMTRKSTGLHVTSEDAIVLLSYLDSSNLEDRRWQDIVQLVPHNARTGLDVRLAARRFAGEDPRLNSWLEQLGSVAEPAWKLEQDQKERERREKKYAEWAAHRQGFADHVEELRSGKVAYVVNPAKAYLRLFRDIDIEGSGYERIVLWMGADLAEAASEGFEEFLIGGPTEPTATDIAQSAAEGKAWTSALIIVAALAERLRKGRGFEDLESERLEAGLYELYQSSIENHAGLLGLTEALSGELRRRGKWESVVRGWFEPHLSSGKDHVNGLRDFLRSDPLAPELAAEWLNSFDRLPLTIERELVQRLLSVDMRASLETLAVKRLSRESVDSVRQYWIAVYLLVNFRAAKALLCAGPIPKELTWSLRDLLETRYADSKRVDQSELDSVLLREWIVTTFRGVWSRKSHPDTGWVGTTNAWDATDFIHATINRLGADDSRAAAEALVRLSSGDCDDYSDHVRAVLAEQQQRIADGKWKPLRVEEIAAIVCDSRPCSIEDLRAVVLDALEAVQDRIWADDVDSVRLFYGEGGSALREEECRDRLIGLFRQVAPELTFDPEVHVYEDREVDIAVSSNGSLRLPIEVKGQWHRKLWTGADEQLDRLYTSDWRAEQIGVYLVLWFGSRAPLHVPRGVQTPSTAAELGEALRRSSSSATAGRISICVLDLSGGV